MGTDIHIVAQVFNGKTGLWEDVSLLGDDILNRSYSWFSFLDGTCGEMEPIAPPRGCPKDFETTENEMDTYHNGYWMGYGPPSWVTLKEILDHERVLGLFDKDNNHHYFCQIDDLKETFKGHDPEHCRIVFGYDS